MKYLFQKICKYQVRRQQHYGLGYPYGFYERILKKGVVMKMIYSMVVDALTLLFDKTAEVVLHVWDSIMDEQFYDRK